MKLEWEQKCKSCNGTGVYVGMAERDGYGVVCQTCDGTGKEIMSIEYEPFNSKQSCTDIHTVLERNVGIMVGKSKDGKELNFGGMPYLDWLDGRCFPPKSEMREYSCPMWWTYQKFQASGCKDCGFGSYSDCPHFKNKEICWKEYDESNK